MWWRWEDDSAWSDSLLSHMEISPPTMLGVSGQHIADTLSVYQVGVIHAYCKLPLGLWGGGGARGRWGGNTYSGRMSQQQDTELLFAHVPFCSFGRLLAALTMLHSVHGTLGLNWPNDAQVNGLFSGGAHGVPRL